MRFGQTEIDEPKPSYVLLEQYFWQKYKCAIVFDIGFERDLRAGAEAHSYIGLSDRGEPARKRVRKLRGRQLVSDLCRTRCNKVQAVVTHFPGLLLWKSSM